MLPLRPARLLPIFLVPIALACGKDSSSTNTEGPPVVIYQVQDLQLTSLAVAARSERNGDLTNDVTVQVNYPIHIAFGITQTGGTAETQIAFGLMQQISEENAAAADGTQATCFLGSIGANHPGDGKEMHYEATFVVPPECVKNNEPTTFNLYAGIDVPGQVAKTESEEDGNVIIFNQDMLEETRNQNCKLGDGSVGCILSVTVNPSPGVNLTFASMELDSSVAVLSSLDEMTGGTDDQGNAVAEVHPPFAKVLSTLTLAGVNTEDATAVTDKNAKVTYSVCPESLFHDTCSGDGWKPLTVATPDTANKRSGHAADVAVPMLKTGQPSVYANLLYAEGETFEAIANTDWASEAKFVIRGCVTSDVEEKVVGSDDGKIAKLDNCMIQRVAVIRSTASSKAFGAFNAFTGTTNAYTFTENLNQRTGDPKTIRVDTSMSTENIMNLDGASSRNELVIGLAGKVNIRAAQTVARAAAYVAVAGSYIDIQQNMLQVALYSFRKEIPEEYTKEATLGYVREVCATFGYNALIIVLQGSMCVGGKAGLEGVFTVKGTPGGAAPFETAQKTGMVTVSFGPISTIQARTQVVAGSEIARGGIEGNLRLVELTAPVTGSLQWGLTSVNPTVLAIKGTVKSTAGLAVLDGDINVYADLREIDMCTKKWKIFGKKFKMSYPCGFRWDRKFDKTLVAFTGDKRSVTLLSRSQTMTLQ